MRRIRVQLYTLVVVALVLVACTAGPTNPGNTTQSSGGKQAANVVATQPLATTPSGATDTPSLPRPVGSFVYPTPIPTQQAVETMMAQATQAAMITPTPISPHSKITPGLLRQMAQDPNNVDFLASLIDQNADQAASVQQQAVRAALDTLKQTDDVQSYEALTIVNSFHVVGTAHAVEVLSQRDDIRQLYENKIANSIDGYDPNSVSSPCSANIPEQALGSNKSSYLLDSAEWNVNLIAAPTAWAEGYSHSKLLLA